MNPEQIATLLQYNPVNGKFTWLENKRKNVIGKIAGCINSQGYRIIMLYGQNYRAHRLAWLYTYGCTPNLDIDHVNGVKDDNRISNLREATQSENNQNKSSYGASGVKGVYWRESRKKWQVMFKKQNEKVFRSLGYFDNIEEAKLIANKWRLENHGNFCNQP
jgi:stalled ribosome alternative rescue factor ArfA